MAAGTDVPTSRLDRRKERTRRALVDAARRLLAERGTTDVSIQEITETADIGFGTFYNHFDTKAELFQVVVAEVLEEYGAALDIACAELEDAAEIYAVGVRMTARLPSTQPAVAQVLVQVGLSPNWSERGLAARALRDIRRGMAEGRFSIDDARLGLVSTAGSLLTFVTLSLERPGEWSDADADNLAGMLLRMLGVAPGAAASVAHRPLPAVP